MFHVIGILANPERPGASEITEKARRYLELGGVSCIDMSRIDPAAKNPDMILTFGGDGTFLIGARSAMKYDIPIMGINLGTVGFLTEEEPDRLSEALDAILKGNWSIEERMLLSVKNIRSGEEQFALNDAVITRGGYARLIRVSCTVNGEEFGVFTSDGMIAATPTGSTGYSLSAGGPIVEPEMNCIVLTPVCAHSLQRCPCIVSAKADIRFRLISERKQTAELQIDGINMGTLEAGDEIAVTGGVQKIRLLRLHPYRFYSLLHSKLREWGSNHT